MRLQLYATSSFVLSLILLSTQVFAEEILYTTDDAYVVADFSDTEDVQHFRSLNTGDLEFLKVWNAWNVTENQNQIISPVLLKFDLSSLETIDVESVSLRMHVEDFGLPTGTTTVSVFSTDRTLWDEDTVTFETAPELIDLLSTTTINSVGWHEWALPQRLIPNSGDELNLIIAFENVVQNNEEIVIITSKEGSKENAPNLFIKTYPQLEQLSPNTAKLYPSDDAYVIVDNSDPDDLKQFRVTNTGLVDFIRLSYALNVDPEQSQIITAGYLKFDLSEIDKEQIKNVNLKMKSLAVQKLNDTVDVDVAVVPESTWSESSLTFSNRPLPLTDSAVTSEIIESDMWSNWDVTDFVKESDSELSLIVALSQANANSEELVSFFSKEDRPNAPYLEIQYAENEGGGCLIATAAYGSEMAPQVQFLREIRDNQLMNTDSGISFMTGFNQVYYSFSPYVADIQRENPMFKEIVKIGITPLLSSLSVMEYAESESQVLGYGIGVILMNIGMYFGAPIMGMIIFKRFSNKRENML